MNFCDGVMTDVDVGDGIGPVDPVTAAPRRDPCVYTITISVDAYVAQFEDGRQEAVEKHDVVFQIDIGGLTFAKFHQILAEHIQMGPGQAVHLSAHDKPRGSGRPRKLRFKGFLEGGDGGPKKKKEPKRLGSQNRCKRCNELGHRQSTCPLNGPKPRKRKKRARRYPSHDEETPNPHNVQNTPSRQMITIPASLQGSPSPITRRRLAIALAEEEASQSQLAASTMDTMVLTIPSSLQGSPSPITRRRLAIALADEEPSQLAEPALGTMMMSVDMCSTSKARKLTPKRKKMA